MVVVVGAGGECEWEDGVALAAEQECLDAIVLVSSSAIIFMRIHRIKRLLEDVKWTLPVNPTEVSRTGG